MSDSYKDNWKHRHKVGGKDKGLKEHRLRGKRRKKKAWQARVK